MSLLRPEPRMPWGTLVGVKTVANLAGLVAAGMASGMTPGVTAIVTFLVVTVAARLALNAAWEWRARRG